MSFLKKWKGTALGALAAPFTGGLSLGAGYLYDTNKQQNQANKKAVDRANAYDMYTWDLANQYNNPKSQMARLKAAGLNPNLVYGSGNVTGNTTGTAGSNGIAQQEVFNGVSKGLQYAQATANLQNTVANNKLLQYQMEKTDADRLLTEVQTTDLRNFLTGDGRSTYHSVFSKPREYAYDTFTRMVNWIFDQFKYVPKSPKNVPQPINPKLPAIGRNKRPGTGTEIDWPLPLRRFLK